MPSRSNTPRIMTDAVLPMRDPYMDQIINGTKNYEFRKYCLKADVQRIWFYRSAPHSAITHVCEIQPARTRNPGDPPLPENGLGNAEYNKRDPEWNGYDYAYKITSVYALRKIIPLADMIKDYGFKSAPQGLVYLPRALGTSVDWSKQRLVLDNDGDGGATEASDEETTGGNDRKTGSNDGTTGSNDDADKRND
ncbi:hypothetical protein PG985_003566 [Apiospora marii]|uniref:EVE domain-containing protein n=1 Tax=Apiospora marii TaxID=335849 RepID=A0ABR1SK22_9PEZI